MHDAILDEHGRPIPPQPASPVQPAGDATAGGAVPVSETSVMSPGLRSSRDWKSALDQLPPQPLHPEA